jgi:hypothetical protein
MIFNIIIAIGLLVGYAAAGYHERGWVDWQGLVLVALLLLPVLYAFGREDK